MFPYYDSCFHTRFPLRVFFACPPFVRSFFVLSAFLCSILVRPNLVTLWIARFPSECRSFCAHFLSPRYPSPRSVGIPFARSRRAFFSCDFLSSEPSGLSLAFLVLLPFYCDSFRLYRGASFRIGSPSDGRPSVRLFSLFPSSLFLNSFFALFSLYSFPFLAHALGPCAPRLA